MNPARSGLRWLTLGGVLLTLGNAVPARAQEPADGPAEPSDAPLVTAPINLAVWPQLSTNQRVGPRVRNFLSLGLAIDRPYQVRGFQAALGAAFVEDSAHGLQLALGLSATGKGEVAGIQLGGVGATASSGLESDLYTGRWGRYSEERPLLAGIQLAGFGASSESTYGLQAVGVFALTFREFKGVQASGLFSYARELYGLQGTGFISFAHTIEGLQLSGGAGIAGTSVGVQLAGLLNVSIKEHTGLQLAPINLGKKVRGVQLGLVNLALKPGGVQLGLINLTHGVPTAAEAWATELVPVSVAWRTGRPALHTLVGVGVMALGGPRPTALVGLGTNVPMGERATFSPDLVYSQAFRLSPARTAAQVLQLRLPVRWALDHGLWLQAGPTLNAGRFVDPAPGYLPYVASTQVGSRTVRFWPGASVGIGLRIPTGAIIDRSGRAAGK